MLKEVGEEIVCRVPRQQRLKVFHKQLHFRVEPRVILCFLLVFSCKEIDEILATSRKAAIYELNLRFLLSSCLPNLRLSQPGKN